MDMPRKVFVGGECARVFVRRFADFPKNIDIQSLDPSLLRAAVERTVMGLLGADESRRRRSWPGVW